jgi:molybdenum-dependent DNA-binding transcriptional regulator ModE
LEVGRLRVLLELARCGTIAAAAEALFLTPSAISQQIAQLEDEAGVKLTERIGRGVKLTAAGHALAGYAERVMAVLSHAELCPVAHEADMTSSVGRAPTQFDQDRAAANSPDTERVLPRCAWSVVPGSELVFRWKSRASKISDLQHMHSFAPHWRRQCFWLRRPPSSQGRWLYIRDFHTGTNADDAFACVASFTSGIQLLLPPGNPFA